MQIDVAPEFWTDLRKLFGPFRRVREGWRRQLVRLSEASTCRNRRGERSDAMKQPGIDALREAVESATDPLNIVNAFVVIPDFDTPMLSPYWENRLCHLANMIVGARAANPAKRKGDPNDR